jgi:hypothetical protein
MKTFTSLLFILLLHCTAGAQNFTPRMNFFSGSEYYYKNCDLVELTDGSIVEMRSYVTTGRFRIHKTDSTGQVIWVKEYAVNDTIGNFFPTDLTLLNDNSFIVSGHVGNANYIYQNSPFAIRIDSSGAVTWKKIFPVNALYFNAPFAVYKAPDTLFLIASVYSQLLNQGGESILKIDTDGNVLGSNFIKVEDQYTSFSCGIISSNGDLVMVGAVANEMHYLRINSSLQVTNSKKYTAVSGGCTPTSMVEDNNGNLVVLGNNNSTENYLYQFNSSGLIYNSIGFTTSVFSNRYFGYRLLQDSTGRLFTIAGEGGYPAQYNQLSDLYCWDASLNNLAVTQYIGCGPEGINLGHGGVLISLQQYYGISGQYPVSYILTDSLGVLSCNSIPLTYTSVAAPAFTDVPESIYYLGNLNFSVGNQIGVSVSNIALAPPLDYCLFNSLPSEDNVAHFTIFPNPSNETIQIDNSDFNNGVYRIYNSLGVMMQTGLIQQNKININSLANGYYILTVSSVNGNTITEHFIKQ